MECLLPFVALLLAFVAGCGLVLLLQPEPSQSSLCELAGTALVLGAGFVALLSFCLGFVIQGARLQWSVAAACAALPLLAGARSKTLFPNLQPPPRITTAALALVVMAQVAWVSWLSLYRYGLGWDGLYVWEVKARIAFSNGGALPLTFWSSGYEVSHSAYPVFLPVFQVWIYQWLGHVDQRMVKWIGPYFYLAALLLLLGFVKREGLSAWIGFLAMMMLAFVPAVVIHEGSATSGYADFPLAVTFLAAVIHTGEYWRTGSRGSMLLAGACAGMLPFVKADGMVLLFGLGLTLLPKVIRDRQWMAGFAILAPGAAMCLGWAAFLRLAHSPQQGDFLPLTPATFFAYANRAGPLLHWAWEQVTIWTQWNLLWPLTVLAAIWLAVSRRFDEWWPRVAPVLLPLVIYPGVFFFSAWGSQLEGHVRSALGRLYLHPAPCAVLMIALALGHFPNTQKRLDRQETPPVPVI